MAPEDRRKRVYEGFERLRGHLQRAAPDLIVAFSNEHITNFTPEHVSAHCVSLADENPALPEFNLPKAGVPGDSAFARGLVEYAYANDFDLAYAAELQLDHGTGMPLSFLTPDYDVPVVVILQNVIFSPMPSVSRSFQLGELVSRYVAEQVGDRRVALLGTGGVSHWVGNTRHGDVNSEFDEWFLRQVASGDYSALLKLSQAEIDAAGDGANEIRNWIAVAGGASGLTPTVVLDETFVPGWNTSAYQVVWE
jgi:aromatic ring-opening dioxygenase catalytic subunit (LigB family)